MSCRVATTSLIAGACIVGNSGLGVLGSVIRATTATGDHGAGYLYNDLTGADDAKEIRGQVLVPPGAGTFFAFEDGSFSLTGVSDGTYSFTYRLFADGVDLGTATGTILVGAAPAVAVTVAGADTADDIAAVSVSAAVPLTDAEFRQMFTWVSDLALIHGLVRGDPLVVTATSRTAGAVVQALAKVGNTTTVSRP